MLPGSEPEFDKSVYNVRLRKCQTYTMLSISMLALTPAKVPCPDLTNVACEYCIKTIQIYLETACRQNTQVTPTVSVLLHIKGRTLFGKSVDFPYKREK